jgi:glycosyltransferase involved in cell wall biosynthesis
MNRDPLRVPDHSSSPTEAISFCVVSTSGKLDRVRKVVTSIQQQSLPAREIIVCGDVPGGLDDTVIRLSCIRAAEENRVGELRNRACQRASEDIIVVCDDNTILRKGFIEEVLKSRPIELLVPRIENPDGTRYWDWATFGGPKGHALLSYNETDPYAYVDGSIYT